MANKSQQQNINAPESLAPTKLIKYVPDAKPLDTAPNTVKRFTG
jgi:hypothetical protein